MTEPDMHTPINALPNPRELPNRQARRKDLIAVVAELAKLEADDLGVAELLGMNIAYATLQSLTERARIRHGLSG